MAESASAVRKGPFRRLSPAALVSVPNGITLARLLGSLAFFFAALVTRRELWNYVGWGVHWFGDALDGWWARRFGQETALGAEMDILADRVETLAFFVALLHFHPDQAVPVLAYVLNFAFVDFYLSNQFVKYGLISVNYFGRVDRRVYALNFSPLGKVLNSTPVPLLIIFLPGWRIGATLLSVALLAVKSYSIARLWRIPLPSAKPGTGPERWPAGQT